ncbi:GNAT family N-acetyltransferase [Macrococcus equipercicus]|uniref:GNAT family N-acetyltransferase n=1 Tax=Macrococcus equipercicus TaxID=69967 RepID=A0ABQ6R9I2_9STAP|nr:GNAT family N-acetyltransferase [Macrococcus equipercicus]KAA1039930.1 GNAT family N-acetyltransferase [Macrococcus equipercicus]
MSEFRRLTIADKDLFNEYFNAWGKEKDSIVPTVTNMNQYLSFEQFIQILGERETSYEVLNTTLFYIEGNKIIGSSNIRHYLNDFLINTGGHIGCGVRPDKRGQGYATVILAQSLKFLSSLGVERALITCDEENIASRQVILNNGGVQDISYNREDGNITNRFWIDIND